MMRLEPSITRNYRIALHLSLNSCVYTDIVTRAWCMRKIALFVNSVLRKIWFHMLSHTGIDMVLKPFGRYLVNVYTSHFGYMYVQYTWLDAKETGMPAANNSMFDLHASVMYIHTRRRLTTVSTVLVLYLYEVMKSVSGDSRFQAPCPDKIDNRSTYVHMLFVIYLFSLICRFADLFETFCCTVVRPYVL